MCCVFTGEGGGGGGKSACIIWCVLEWSGDGDGGPWPAGLPKPSPVLTVNNTGNLHHPILPRYQSHSATQ